MQTAYAYCWALEHQHVDRGMCGCSSMGPQAEHQHNPSDAADPKTLQDTDTEDEEEPLQQPPTPPPTMQDGTVDIWASRPRQPRSLAASEPPACASQATEQ